MSAEVSAGESGMTQRERRELCQLVRQRARVEKSLADCRIAEVQADFEDALLRWYSYDDDEIWAQAAKRAKKVVKEGNIEIAKRCAELGIPKDFAPKLDFGWSGAGRNMVRTERTDMRRQAAFRLDAMAKSAKVEIDRVSVETQERLVAGGFESDEARAWLDAMPRMRTLIPDLADNEVRALLPGGAGRTICAECAGPVHAGRSDVRYCSDACRQRAYRKRDCVTDSTDGDLDNCNAP